MKQAVELGLIRGTAPVTKFAMKTHSRTTSAATSEPPELSTDPQTLTAWETAPGSVVPLYRLKLNGRVINCEAFGRKTESIRTAMDFIEALQVWLANGAKGPILTGHNASLFHTRVLKSASRNPEHWFSKLFESKPPFAFRLGEIYPSANAQMPVQRVVILTSDGSERMATNSGAVASSHRSQHERYDQEFTKQSVNWAKKLHEEAKRNVKPLAEDPWEQANSVVNSFMREGQTPVDLELNLMSLIQPSRWHDGGWKRYHARVRELALRGASRGANRRLRRLHVLDTAVLSKPDELVSLLDVAFYDLLYGIHSRALMITPPLPENPDSDIPVLGDIGLHDAATFTTTGPHFDFILSNLKPYFMDARSDFDLILFPKPMRQRIYQLLRGNFVRAWNYDASDERNAIYRLPQIMDAVLNLPDKKTSLPPGLWFLNEERGFSTKATVGDVQAFLKDRMKAPFRSDSDLTEAECEQRFLEQFVQQEGK